MKRFIPAALLAICFLATSPVITAQNCSGLNNWTLRGTYTMSGSGYIDLSKLFPDQGFASGLTPMSFVGGHVYNGIGGGTGWVSMNIGGTQLAPEYSDYTYSMQPNCSVLVTYKLTFKEFGVTIPFKRVGVIVPKPGGLEIHSLSIGRPVGMPAGAGLNLNVLQRISMDMQ
jgi:hypothetical protein